MKESQNQDCQKKVTEVKLLNVLTVRCRLEVSVDSVDIFE